MSSGSLIVIGHEPACPLAAEVACQVIAAWPDGSPPALTTIEAITTPGVALLVAQGKDSLSNLRPIIHKLADRHIAAVILCDEPASWKARLGRDGVFVRARRSPVQATAAVLATLLARQREIDELAGELAVAKAAQGGLCGEMDRLHDELNLASRVQRQFIPRKMPEVRGLEFASIFRPAGYVSGDIFDLRQADDDVWSFFLADVVGHGVPAALLTMVVSRSVVCRERVGLSWRPVPPAEVLARLNEELCRQPEGPQRFATAVYGLVDARTGMVRLAGAGHPPPLLMTPGRETRKLETEGPLLGVFDGATFDEVCVEMTLGSTLLLYSDGFELAFPNGATRSEILRPTTRYLDHLGELACADGSPGVLTASMRRLDEVLDRQAGSLHRPDDVTAVGIARVRAEVLRAENAAAA